MPWGPSAIVEEWQDDYLVRAYDCRKGWRERSCEEDLRGRDANEGQMEAGEREVDVSTQRRQRQWSSS